MVDVDNSLTALCHCGGVVFDVSVSLDFNAGRVWLLILPELRRGYDQLPPRFSEDTARR